MLPHSFSKKKRAVPGFCQAHVHISASERRRQNNIAVASACVTFPVVDRLKHSRSWVARRLLVGLCPAVAAKIRRRCSASVRRAACSTGSRDWPQRQPPCGVCPLGETPWSPSTTAHHHLATFDITITSMSMKKIKVAHTRLPSIADLPVGDMSQKPGGRLPLLSARPTVTLATLKRAATNFAAWWTEARWVWTVCLRLLPDSIAAAIWTRVLLHLSPAH